MKINIYPKSLLERMWQSNQKAYSPDAKTPPLCLRCGRPIDRDLSINALSRYADVQICEVCGMDEALRDMAGKPLPLRDWHAVAHHEPEQTGDDPLIVPECCFEAIYQDTEQSHESILNYPVSELVYSRSDCDGSRWWTSWFDLHKERLAPELIEEIDRFMEALFRLPELKTLASLSRMCRSCAQPTGEPTEFNLYAQTEHFYLWLRPIIREKDYNLYVHFYLKP